MPRKDINFKTEYLQILKPNGSVDKKLEPTISNDGLLQLYRYMHLARIADDKQLKLQRQGRIGTFPPSTGQEAAVCGPVLAMRSRDWFVSAFRELGGLLMRGVGLDKVLLYYNGYEEGNLYEDDRTLPISIPVASQALHAVGIGYAMQYKGEKDTAAVAFLGDGGTSQGDFHEALNFAGVWKAPAIFIIQNNQWAISIPRSKQTSSQTLAQKAIAYDIPGIQVDGNDVLAMYVATQEALNRAYAGEGPTLIEAVTYRLRMHTTADDPKKYRADKEVEEWESKDPLVRFETYLRNKEVLTDTIQQQIHQENDKAVNDAVQALESFKPERFDTPFDFVYGTPHASIEKQRQEFLSRVKEESSNA